MDKKTKTEEINLDLGVDPTELLLTPPISEKTKAHVAHLMEIESKEAEAVEKIRERKRKEAALKEEGTDRIYRRLIELANQGQGIGTPELMQLANSDDHVGTMIRLHNYIKKRGWLWDVKKSKSGGKTTYRLIPRTLEEPTAS